jgi:hypothetical protein
MSAGRIRRTLCALLGAGASLAVVACGSGGATRSSAPAATAGRSLTASQYSSELAAIARREDRAQATVQRAFRARSVSEIARLLRGFAADQQAVAADLANLSPPPDARGANIDLTRAFRDNAAAVRMVAGRVARAKTPRAALALITSATAARRSGQEIDAALSRLRKLGYTRGS